ncbi:MAG: hypothetical protein GY803_32405, partial [Chloroflexi bacterium]|nr:hypothetical protein [Chloroflexota bacterium]
MSSKSFNSSLRYCLILTGVVLVVVVLQLFAPRQPALAQTDSTAVPPVTLNEPILTPNAGTGQFPNGWLKIVGKSSHVIYLTANGQEANGIGGAWQPELPQAGHYRIEVYLGVNEFHEYALLFPEKLDGMDRLTRSAQYIVSHANGDATVVVEQDLRESGW